MPKRKAETENKGTKGGAEAGEGKATKLPTRCSSRIKNMAAYQPESNGKKAAAKKPAEQKTKKTKAKKEDGPAQNGDTKTNEVTEATEEATEDKA